MKRRILISLAMLVLAVFGMSLHVSADDTRITSGDYVYTENGDGTITIRQYIGTAENLVVPSMIDGKTVTAFGPNTTGNMTDYGVLNRDSLRSVRIPGTIKVLGNIAFANCQNLEEVILEDGFEETEGSPFEQSYQISHIVIPGSVKRGGFYYDFRNIHTAGPIGSGCDFEFGWTQKLPDHAFSRLTLDQLEIPDSITEIGENAFMSCTLNSISLPSGLVKIGSSAFNECNISTDLVIPGGVEEIGSAAFWGTSSPRIFFSNGIEAIPDNSYFTSSVQALCIPASVTSLGTYGYNWSPQNVFYEGSEESWNSIAYDAEGKTRFKDTTKFHFDCQYGFENNYSYAIENNEVCILGYTGSDSVVNIPAEISGSAVTGIIDRAFSNNLTIEEVNIPDSVTSLGSSLFSGCSNLRRVKLSNNLTKLENYSFSGCTNLESVTMPENLTEIGDYAFFNCSNLETITLPDTLLTIGNYAFSNCGRLMYIQIPEGISAIGNNAFSQCTNLSDLSFPDHYFEIGLGAFSGCSGLRDENGFVIVGTVMFEYYGDETEITVPDYVTVLDKTFRDCGNITKVTLPAGLTEIRNSAFYKCSSLQSITLPDSLTVLGSSSFSNCTSLSEIEIPYGIAELGSNAFYKCTNLHSVIIPETVRKIDTQCFAYCENLKEIVIPANMQTIRGYAFQNCTNLQDVYYPGNQAEWSAITIDTSNTLLLNANLHLMKDGYAYAVLENDGDFIFFRSLNYYSPGSQQTAASDLEGNVYSGRVFRLIEENTSGSLGWENYASSIKTVSVADRQYIAPVSMKGWFYGCYNMTSFQAKGFDTSAVTDMTELFYNCSSLDSLDLSSFDTSNVTTMRRMFSMTAFNTLDISGFDTSNVTDMSLMFEHSKNIGILDLQHFNTSNVTTMYDMFIECYNLSSLNVSSFSTENVTTMKGMFLRCRALEELDLSNFRTEKVTDFSGMFGECSELEKLDISQFDTSSDLIEDFVFYSSAAINEIKIGPQTRFRLPEGVWVHESGNYVKSDLQLYNAYPDHGEELKGTWHKELNLTVLDFEWEETESGYNASAVFNCADNGVLYTVPAEVTLIEDTAPGCETEGVKRYQAELNPTDSPDSKVHTEEKTVTIEPYGHAWSEWAIITEPTCTEAGEETRTCANDPNHIETRTIDALGHSLIRTEAVNAACEQTGNTEYWTCDRCGKYFSDEAGNTEIEENFWITQPTGHDWGEWTVTVQPTCTEAGEETRICANDPGHTETRTADALGHSLIRTEAVNAACEQTGNTEYWTCDRCGKYFSDSEGITEIEENSWVTQPIGHNWGEWTVTVQPTCTEAGEETRTCANDPGHIETRPIEAIGHDYGNWETVKEPTCEEEGLKQQICANDPTHINSESIPALGHKWGNWIVGQEPTCTKTGYRVRVCQTDPSHTETQTLEKIPHSWGEWTIVKQPTFEEEGVLERTCAVCGNKDTTTIPVISHTHSFVKTEAAKATCEEAGNIEYYYCEECGRYYKDAEGSEKITSEETVIPPLGHLYGEWQIVREAACEEDGLERRVCEHDENHVEELTIPAIGHDYGNWEVIKEADCEEAGQKQKVCANDPTHVITEEIPAAGHNWGEWTVTVQPTCTEDGEEQRICANDQNHIETRPVEALGHAWEGWTVTVQPTCTEAGEETRICTNDPTHVETRPVEALGHNLVKTEAVEATCETAGNTAYWTCSTCGKYFSDEAGQNEIQANSWISPAKGHTYQVKEWIWAEDYSTASVNLVCANDSAHTVTVDAQITVSETEPGYKDYTAAAEYNGTVYTDTKTEEIAAGSPTVVTVTINTATGRPSVVWQTREYAVKYQLYRSTEENGSYTKITEGTGTSYLDTDAEAGTEYFYKVRCVGTDGKAGGYSEAVSIKAIPSQPTGITTKNNPATGNIKISWDEMEDAYKYQVYRATSSNGTYTRIATTENTYYVDTKGESGKTYYYKVRSVTENSVYSKYSSKKSAKCSETVLTLTAVIDTASGSPVLSWNTAEEIRYYQLYRSESEDGTYTKVTNTTNTSKTDSTAEAGKTYWYKVRVIDTDSKSGSYSEPVSITAIPSQPTGITTKNNPATGNIRISWDEMEDAYKYQVYRSTSSNGTYTRIATTENAYYVDTKGESGKTYYYKVRSVTENSVYSKFSSKKSAKCSETVMTITAKTDTASGHPKLAWNTAEEIRYYQLYRAESEDGTYTKLGNMTVTSKVDSTAETGKTYWYKVRVIDTNSKSGSYSEAVSIVCKPGKVTGLKATVVSSTSKPKLTWTAVEDAVKYQVYYSTSKTGTYKRLATTANTSYTHTGAAADTTYYYKVRAVSENGTYGTFSSIVTNPDGDIMLPEV